MYIPGMETVALPWRRRRVRALYAWCLDEVVEEEECLISAQHIRGVCFGSLEWTWLQAQQDPAATRAAR